VNTAGQILRVSFTADRAALIALLQREARISPSYRDVRRRNMWQTAVWGTALAVVVAFLGYQRAATPEIAPGSAFRAALLFTILWTIFAALVFSSTGYYRLLDGMIRRRLERAELDADCGPFIVTLVPEGIACDGAHTSRMALWSEVDRLSIRDDAIYIDLTSGSAFRIPREAFRSDIEFRRFVEFACARAGI
jgi:hypothetical protein